MIDQPMVYATSARRKRAELVPNKADPSCEGTHYCLVTSDLLAAAIYEHSHGVAGCQGRMEKLRGAVDADRETAATPFDSKF